MKYWKGLEIQDLADDEVFVFGSNPQARHFAGAAKKALSFGAIPINRSKNTLGICRGLSPNNKTYALITKSLEAGYIEPETQILYDKEGFLSVSPEQISSNIDELYRIARMQEHKDKKFLITYQYQTWPNGSPKKSLNGYTSKEMFDMFVIDKDIPPNIVFHESYEPHIKNLYKNKEEEVDKKYTYFFYLKSPFSNFHPAKFNYKNINFISNEQFMMYCKAKLFQDEVVAQKIIDINNTPLIKEFIEGKISTQDIINNESLVKDWQQLMQKIKKLGREVKNYNEDVWVKKRLSIVFFGAKLKFTQNKDLEKKLLSTGNTIMVEASRFDKIWGCGLQESEAKITEEKDWPGLNLLGKVLTKLKTQLNNELNNKSGIEVVNFYKIGKKIPENGVYIGRENKGLGLKQSKFANPFKMKGDGDKERKRVLNEYKGWVWKELNKGNITLNEVLDLKDKKLVCYCSPKSCHGDVLRSLVNYVLNNKSNLEKETNQKLKI